MKKLDLKYKFEDAIYATYNIGIDVRFKFEGDLRKNLRNNEKFRNKERGRRCFILGNGPSIKSQPLERLREEQTFVCNYFYRHEKIRDIDPKYYFIVDGKLTTGEWSPDMLSEIRATCPGAEIFLDGSQSHVDAVYKFDQETPVNWIAGGKLIYPGFDYAVDLCRRIGGDNVVKIALQAAIFMGFEEIILLGVDGDGLFRELVGLSSHFYSSATDATPADYRKMELDLWFCTEGFRSWRAIAERFASGPVKIVNATNGGLLNVFPRARLEDLME